MVLAKKSLEGAIIVYSTDKDLPVGRASEGGEVASFLTEELGGMSFLARRAKSERASNTLRYGRRRRRTGRVIIMERNELELLKTKTFEVFREIFAGPVSRTQISKRVNLLDGATAFHLTKIRKLMGGAVYTEGRGANLVWRVDIPEGTASADAMFLEANKVNKAASSRAKAIEPKKPGVNMERIMEDVRRHEEEDRQTENAIAEAAKTAAVAIQQEAITKALGSLGGWLSMSISTEQ